MKTEICYWRIDHENGEIRHKSGTYMVAQGSSGNQYPSLVSEKDKDKYGEAARKFIIIKTNKVQKRVSGEELILNLRGGVVQKIYPAVGDTWIDLPTGKITKIQIMQEGGSITTDIGESVGINLLSEKENSQSLSSSTTLSSQFEMTASGEIPLGPKLETKFSLGLSTTQTSEISNRIKEQTKQSLKNSKNWQTSVACPSTAIDNVRFAITEQIIRVRENPMRIEVEGKEPVYIQESISFTQVNFTKEYAIGSPEIKRKWDELKRDYPELLSKVEENLYINIRK